jgi:hypothetical protein
MKKRIFIECELCGKRLIERLPNGLWSFLFGRPTPEDKDNPTLMEQIVPVHMLIHGSIKIRCLRKSCRLKNPDHWNVLNFFPNIISDITEKESLAIDINEDSGIQN